MLNYFNFSFSLKRWLLNYLWFVTVRNIFALVYNLSCFSSYFLRNEVVDLIFRYLVINKRFYWDCHILPIACVKPVHTVNQMKKDYWTHFISLAIREIFYTVARQDFRLTAVQIRSIFLLTIIQPTTQLVLIIVSKNTDYAVIERH